MNLIFLVLIACFFFFMYVLYYLSHDDFVILRRDIPLEKIFNIAFLSSFVALLSARLFFTIFSNNPQFLRPLVFLAFPYFPGLSLIGGILGGSIFVYAYSRYRKLPGAKIFDLFAMAFIGTLPLGFLLTFIILLGNTSFFFNLLFLVATILAVVFIKVFFPFSSRGEIKDGSLGLLFLTLFSLSYFLIKLFIDIKTFSFGSVENLTVLVTLFVSLILLINHEIMEKFLIKK